MKLVSEDLEQTLTNMGLGLGRSTTREVWALCPGHDDHRPTSFSVNRESGASFCFACGYKRPDLVSLACDVMKLDAWAAARWLRENGASLTARIERVRDRQPRARRGKVKTSSGYSIEGEFSVFGDVPDSELNKRDISREAADYFEIRWDEEAENYIIPIKDHATGKLIGWQRRRKPRPKNYPKNITTSQHIFGGYEFSGDRAIVVESPLDVATLWTRGYVGGIATFGASVSSHQMRLIQSIANRVLLAMDSDEAGTIAISQMIRFFGPKMPTHVLNYLDVDFDEAKDPGEMTVQQLDRAIGTAIFATHLPEARAGRRVVRR